MSKVVLTGIIKKKSPKAVLGRHVWQARYFVLTSSELVYYKNMKDYQAKKPATGSISLQAITKIRVLRTKSAGRFDLLTNQSNRIWAFKADQSGTWVKKIQQTCEALGQADVGVVTAKKPAAETKDNHKRRAGITSAGAADDEDISAEDQKKGPEDVTFIKNAVKNLKTFKNTSAEELDAIVSAMYKVSIKTGGVVQKEGENADKLYVVAKGGFNLIQADLDTDEPVVISELKQGGIVTEYALLYEQESDYTFEASRATTLWAITRHQYRDIIKTARQAGFAARVKFIKQTVLLGKFAKQDLNKIAEALEVASYKKGTNIVTQGEVGDAFYLLVKGTAVAKIDGNDVKEYNDAGDFFGERSLIRDETRAATVTATSNCEVLALKKKDFTALMGDVSGLLSKLEEEYKTASKANVSAAAESESDEEAATAPTGGGGGGFRPSIWDEGQAKGGSKGMSLLPQGFDPLAENSDEGSDAEDLTDEEGVESKSSTTTSTIEGVTIENLKIIGTLGKGTFGHVQLVEDLQGKMYALKAINKQHVLEHDQLDHLKYEKDVQLELGDFPFVVRLYGTLQDNNFVYFLLEPSMCGELFSLLAEEEKFDKPTAQFYAASIVVAFQFMHNKDIIYRDLKPENLLLGTDGYLKVTDFGFAKKTTERTYTFCGTPDYLAPEIVSNAGHGPGADWWTLGVFLYEMLTGVTPFYDEDGPSEMYEKILARDFEYPEDMDPDAIDLIDGLLTVKPTKRYGVIKSVNLREHPWFDGFDWEGLEAQTLDPPFVKDIGDKYDLSNFDDYDDDEEEENEEFEYDGEDPFLDF